MSNSPPPEAPSNDRRLRVLLVEDAEIDARIVLGVLEAWPDGVAAARRVANLDDGLAALMAEALDLILLDMELPDSSGMETVERMLAACGETPVVVLTSHASGALGEAAIQAGAQDFVTKGQATPMQLRRVIRFAVERQRLLARLYAAERRHLRLLDRVRDPVCLLDGAFRLLYANEPFCRLIGQERRSLIGSELLDLVPEMSLSTVKASLLRRSGRERTRIEVPVSTASGHVRTLDFVVTACGDGTYEAVGQDLTAFRDPGTARAARREQWAGARELAPEGSVVIGGDGSISAANAAFCDLVGRPREELLSSQFSALLPESEAALFDRFIAGFEAAGAWPVSPEDGVSILPAEEGAPAVLALRGVDGDVIMLEVEFHRRGAQLEGFALPRHGPARRAS